MMSMMWMRTPGQAWSEFAIEFIGMWCVIMLPMMLPCLLPVLWRYRRTPTYCAGKPQSLERLRLHRRTLHVALGYFCVYVLLGLFVLTCGVTLAELARLHPALAARIPLLGALAILLAGLNQFTGTKLRQLRRCRAPSPIFLRSQSASGAWYYGFHVGVLCLRCCAGQMMILLVLGMMELRWMALITGAIALERLGPFGERVALAVGVIAVAVGMVLISQAIPQA